MAQQGLQAPPVSIAAITPGPILPSPTPAPELPEANLSLVPSSLPLPADFVIGTGPAQLDSRSFPTLITPPPTPSIPVMDEVAKHLDFQDIQWPLGEALEGHFLLPVDHPIGNWVPFLSVLQDNDELDAHIRNGVGVGATYRFNEHARVDVEVQYLESSGDANPAIGSETRGSIIFSFDF